MSHFVKASCIITECASELARIYECIAARCWTATTTTFIDFAQTPQSTQTDRREPQAAEVRRAIYAVITVTNE